MTDDRLLPSEKATGTHSPELPPREKPDSELQEALDELESSAISASNACPDCTHPSCERRRYFLPEARQSIESLFERRIAEMRKAHYFEKDCVNRRVGVELTELQDEIVRLRAELALLRETALTPEEAAALAKVLTHHGYCTIWDGPTFSCNCPRGPLIKKLHTLRIRISSPIKPGGG